MLTIFRTGGVSIRMAFLFGPLLMCGACATSGRAPLDPVMPPEMLERRAADDRSGARLIIVDVRDADAYAAGHVAGAVHADATQWKAESLAGDTGLNHAALWHERIGDLGITADDTVVVYDDGRMTEAARIWFILQHFGVSRAAVLDGGYPALEPLISEGRLALEQAAHPIHPVDFRPVSGAEGRIALVERQRVLQALQEGQAQVFDARTPAEFSGADPRKNARAGHLPTAVNVPHTELLDARGRLKSPADLQKIFDQVGLKRGRPIITHCESGGRASLAALAAMRAGYGPVMNYYLSFGDWAADASCPVEKSTE